MKKIIATGMILFGLTCDQVSAQSQADLATALTAMTKEIQASKSVVLMKSVVKRFHLDPIKNQEQFDVMYGILALAYLKEGKNSMFENYIDKIKNKFNQTSYLHMAAEHLFRKKERLLYAESIARKTLTIYNSYKDDQKARPASFELNDWNRFMKMAATPYHETYAQILHRNGHHREALAHEEIALKEQHPDDISVESLELYTALLAANGDNDKAYWLLLESARVGRSSDAMNELLQQLYVKRGGSRNDAQKLIDSITQLQSEHYLRLVAKKMLKGKVAPDFTLTDLSGKQVTLSDLKGKIVVLDFWATWCAPCVASLPVMQRLVKQHPEVVFLFIATQEKGLNSEDRIDKLISDHQYDFRVLIDKPVNNIFQVSAAYQLTGIPAKVVIDQHGKELFLTTGFSSDTELMRELEAMIALAKNQH